MAQREVRAWVRRRNLGPQGRGAGGCGTRGGVSEPGAGAGVHVPPGGRAVDGWRCGHFRFDGGVAGCVGVTDVERPRVVGQGVHSGVDTAQCSTAQGRFSVNLHRTETRVQLINIMSQC